MYVRCVDIYDIGFWSHSFFNFRFWDSLVL